MLSRERTLYQVGMVLAVMAIAFLLVSCAAVMNDRVTQSDVATAEAVLRDKSLNSTLANSPVILTCTATTAWDLIFIWTFRLNECQVTRLDP